MKMLPERGETGAYVNNRGQIVLTQTEGRENQVLLVLEASDVPAVMAWLQNLKPEAEDIRAAYLAGLDTDVTEE